MANLFKLSLLSLVLSTGCTATSKWMKPLETAPALNAKADTATLVIMRPSNFGYGIRFTVVDSKGNFLGQPLAESYYTIDLAPGTYDIVAWSENVDMVRANLEAGKTYYLLARVYMGFWTSRVALEAYTPTHPDWSKKAEWLSKSTYHEVDRAGGTQHLSEKKDEVMEKIEEARKKWETLEGKARAVREF